MSGESERWRGPKSDFPWEEEALAFIHAKMPSADPYRAWQTFTFTAASSHVREVDLFLAAPGGLFLVEIKSHPGVATNNGSTWIFRDGNRTRTIENPLHFTDAKAKDLKNRLIQAARELSPKLYVPRIEAAVFLSAPNLQCRFDEIQRARVFGRDGLESQTGLDGIWDDWLNQPPRTEDHRVTPSFSRQLPKLMQYLGIQRLRKNGKIGPYELAERAFDAGPTWEDYLAENSALPADEPRRVRIYLSELKATSQEQESTRRAARREYLALQGISHDGIVRAEQFSNEHQAGPAIVFQHGKDWQRMDQFMAERGAELPIETRVEMIRQLADALGHAHRRHLYHRALAARCIYVQLDGRYPRLRIADWQVAARPVNGTTGITTMLSPGAASLGAHIEKSAGPYLAPELASPDAVAPQLDVFGLGALSYLILTGKPPAADREALLHRLAAERALVPSPIADSVTPAMDELIRRATAVHPADRTDSVRDFLNDLDKIEDELTAPDRAPAVDPLTAVKNDQVRDWKVIRILGKGSTSRALLMKRQERWCVFKVALNDAAAIRLRKEAAQLDQLSDSHVAKLLEPPFDEGSRTIIAVEYIDGDTLADELRLHGPLTIHELERLGEDLLHAVKFLDDRKVWHRDIKPDNLALRPLPRKRRELVLFDFSLAGTPDTELDVGTRDYLDPFLGLGGRTSYDLAAELYSVAVTLHEMASGELPSWGDGVVGARLVDPRETHPQLAEDLFDSVLRDRLVRFFNKALQRDATQRFATVHDMTRAWTDIFRSLDQDVPLTTSATVDQDEVGDAEQKRDLAAREATADTPLVSAGLSPRALSIAQQRLGVSTVRELAALPARRITKLRGIGSGPRYELVRRGRDWRLRLSLSEAAPKKEKALQAQRGVVPATGTVPAPGGDAVPTGTAPGALDPADADVDAAHLSIDELVARLLPAEPPDLSLVVGKSGPDGAPPRISTWATPRDIAVGTRLADDEVTKSLDRLRSRWTKSVPALTPLRDDAVALIREHGGVMEWRQLATALLAARGCDLDDQKARLTLAGICVRAVAETEERRDKPRLATRRLPERDRVLIAAADAGEESAPRLDDLFAYAEMLGGEADTLASRDPLPGVTEVRQTLRDVPVADHAVLLSDTDLVQLAAGASANAAVTSRLELYPRDLAHDRAIRISQVSAFLAEPGLTDAEVAQRVNARFPGLQVPVPEAQVGRLLKALDLGVTRLNNRNIMPSMTSLGSTQRTGRPPHRHHTESDPREQVDRAWQRLYQAARLGGFAAVKVRLAQAAVAAPLIAAQAQLTGISVSGLFVTTLRQVVADVGRPQWGSVLAADSPDASPQAKAGFARLLAETWARIEAHVCDIDAGVVFLHDATPLARYTGGMDLLARLIGAARHSGGAPHGLWLLCPMEDPHRPPCLDGEIVPVLPGEAEQIELPRDFGALSGSRRAS